LRVMDPETTRADAREQRSREALTQISA
jgi:hypothetical protein